MKELEEDVVLKALECVKRRALGFFFFLSLLIAMLGLLLFEIRGMAEVLGLSYPNL